MDSRNVLFAIILSTIVLVVWATFFEPPVVEKSFTENQVVQNEANARVVDEQKVRDDYVSAVSLKTWVTADDIAYMIHFLDSPSGIKISGQALAVDGHTESIT